MTFDARQFLAELFRPGTARGGTPADLPAEWRDVFEERASIMEYEGGLSREHAEAAALDETRRSMAIWTK